MADAFEKTLVIRAVPIPRGLARDERCGTLTVLLGGDVGATHRLTSSVVLGRGPVAQISLDDDGVSRRHCRITKNGDAYEIEDLGSTNGTYVERVRIYGRERLREGARIQVGNTMLRFALQDRLDEEAARRMYDMAVRDGLTSAYNRRYFDERLQSEFAFAVRHGTALSVMLIDVDHFKRVNDTHGHQAGDEVLRRISAALRGGVRAEDVVARYGGEEFAVIARGIDVRGARLFAERIRAMIEREHVVWQGTRIPITASIGVAHNHACGRPLRAEHLVNAADDALYAAKRCGRNRVELAAPLERSSLAGPVLPGHTADRRSPGARMPAELRQTPARTRAARRSRSSQTTRDLRTDAGDKE